MTSFSSPVPEIAALHIDPIPTRPIKVARAVRVEGTVVLVDEKGRIYSDGVHARAHFTLSRIDMGGTGRTFEACRRLGLVSKAMLAEHARVVKEREQHRDRKWAADSIEEKVKALGLVLTPKQKRVIAAAKKGSV